MKASIVTLGVTLLAGTLAGLGQNQPPKERPSSVPAGHPQIPLPEVDKNWPQGKASDVESVDAIVKAFYEAPAGAPGQARDWDRYRSLFVPQARLIPARPGADGTSGAFFLAVSDYIEANKVYFEKGGFWDREISRKTEAFGNIVHVWSTYESRRKSEEAAPYVRGINSIQLLRDRDRYWIIGVFWDYERPDSPIPAEYLPAKAP